MTSEHPLHPRGAGSITMDMLDELAMATKKFGPFASPHEGYAVILEELDELWDAIKTGGSAEDVRAEAIQVGAMAMRFCLDMEGWQ